MVLVLLLGAWLEAQTTSDPSPQITVQLRAIGNCEDAGTSEPMTYSERGKQETICLQSTVIIDENDIAHAEVKKDVGGSARLDLEFKEKGAQRLKKSTSELIGERIAFVINGKIISAARVYDTISKDLALQPLDQPEAQDLADEINKRVHQRSSTSSKSRVGI